MPTASELPVNIDATANEMAEEMFGNGITILDASYTGATVASGIYSNGNALAPGVTPADTGVILSTGSARSITNSSGDVNVRANTTTVNNTAGDAELTAIAGQNTFDAAIFEAEFVPQGSTLTMQFIFASEEYLEYVSSGFNDSVGVWVNGVQAEMTIGSGDISIDNINPDSNENLYIDNDRSDDNFNTEMDGFTVTLTLTAPVNPNESNSIKIGIADGGDRSFDSNLLIAGDSIQTALVANDDAVTVQEGDTANVDVLANDMQINGAALTITHINGQPVVAGSSVTLADGEVVTLNSDGSFTVAGQDDVDSDTDTTFSYTVEDSVGNTDTGFVTLTTTPCFVAGVLIDTVDGPRAVEDLTPGTLVLTRDHGPQPLRWIGRSTRRALGAEAPVIFAKNALGQHAQTALSPNHRVLVRSAWAEVLFGQYEVLVKAKDLINDRSIRPRADGELVTYVHLLFDSHQIICGDGLESESYHPGEQTLHSFDPETRAEILDLMADGMGINAPSARLSLKPHERALLGTVTQ
ncbi:choice-of-anchor L domain-containing protein [Phaeobacter sp.]|uniref:choice-of-anchor L domain-containing protein n=1 Tax=Phaeobacter sp. TaxID=1902409 RepID=UPI0025D7AA2A|nr:choice-of-anchor L domain-containing protein [Phaeobacter sp.]